MYIYRVDVVYESVGGDFFDICVDALAVKGRLIVIGFISGYSSGEGWIEGWLIDHMTNHVLLS